MLKFSDLTIGQKYTIYQIKGTKLSEMICDVNKDLYGKYVRILDRLGRPVYTWDGPIIYRYEYLNNSILDDKYYLNKEMAQRKIISSLKRKRMEIDKKIISALRLKQMEIDKKILEKQMEFYGKNK